MATKKITALPEATSFSDDDLIQIVDDPSGTPANKKMTLANFIAGLDGITNLDGGNSLSDYGGVSISPIDGGDST